LELLLLLLISVHVPHMSSTTKIKALAEGGFATVEVSW
jgi:hypothetical protein